MKKPLSLLNKAFERAGEKNLSGSDLLLYLHLWNLFNRAHWTESLLVTDSRLMELMNLRDSSGKPISLETVRRAKQRLKNKGFIDFKSGGGKNATEYKLVDFLAGSPPEDSSDNTPEDSPDNPPEDSGAVSQSTRARRRKDLEDLEDLTTTTTTYKGGREKNFSREISKEIIHAWIRVNGENPCEGDEADLLEFEKRYGAEKVVAAIEKCRRMRQSDRISINYVASKLEVRRGKADGGIGENWETARPEWLKS